MTSLADELGKLFELHKMGALTESEYALAKTSTIARFTGAPSPSPAQEQDNAANSSNSSGGGGEGNITPLCAGSVATLATTTTATAAAQQEREEKEGKDQIKTQQRKTVSALNARIDVLLVPPELEEAQLRFPSVPLAPFLEESATDSSSSAVPFSSAVSSSSKHLDSRVAALSHLDRIVQNVLNHPAELKYRRLRQRNAKLSAELFSVPGVVGLLKYAGFVLQVAEEGGSGSGEGEKGDPAYVLLPPVAPSPLSLDAVQEARLQDILAAINFLRSCYRNRDAYRLRAQRSGLSVVLAIRSEKATEAAAAGGAQGLLDLLVQLFTRDEAGDGLRSSCKHADTLASLLEIVAEGQLKGGSSSLEEQEVEEEAAEEVNAAPVRLCLHHPVVFDCVVRQKGGLELLLAGAGCRLIGTDNNSDVTWIEFPLRSASSQGEGGLFVPGMTRGCELAKEAAASVTATRTARSEEARREAVQAMKVERRREGRRSTHEADRAREEQLAQQLAHVKRRRRGNVPGDSSSPSDSDSSSSQEDEGGRDGASTRGGTRIPVAQALAMLMGKKRD